LFLGILDIFTLNTDSRSATSPGVSFILLLPP
jgi:hypothetical protein